MNITVITQPPFEPVSLANVYKHLRLDAEGSPLAHPDDAMIETFITSARVFVEQATRRALVQQTIRLSMSVFQVYGTWALSPSSSWPQSKEEDRILLRRPPIIRVDSVKYVDGSNVLQTVSAADYYVTDEQVPELRFVSGFSPPTIYDRPDAVRVDYVAGYAPEGSPPTTREEYVANIPKPLHDAVLLGVQLLYDDLTVPQFDTIVRMRELMMQPYRIQLAV